MTTPTIVIKAPISVGELIDKLTILEIKQERIKSAEKLIKINHEHKNLIDIVRSIDIEAISQQKSDLLGVNKSLWVIEDNIRLCEKNMSFGADFISLARSVYKVNDRRASLKREIDHLMNSDLSEQKSYEPYD